MSEFIAKIKDKFFEYLNFLGINTEEQLFKGIPDTPSEYLEYVGITKRKPIYEAINNAFIHKIKTMELDYEKMTDLVKKHDEFINKFIGTKRNPLKEQLHTFTAIDDLESKSETPSDYDPEKDIGIVQPGTGKKKSRRRRRRRRRNTRKKSKKGKKGKK